ncbi:MAG: CZB domain-containing protein [Gammaproteobacteria bacterium]|nr:CZB domain-containing protein [Gammaproteobacteria bacterium]
MTKQEALGQVRHAKSAHIRWRAYVQAMVAGLEIEEQRAPVHHKDCDFGQWFYGDGFRAFGHWAIYQDVEFSHELLHEVYRLLHRVLEEGDLDRAAVIMDQLVGLSHSLLAGLELLEEEIRLDEAEQF